MNLDPRDTWTLLASIFRYGLAIRPRVQRELECLRTRARAIPDPALRAQASFVLNDESWTIEGAAFFATLVPRQQRSAAVRLMVTFQALYNYLDALGELPDKDPFQSGMRLHEAIDDVLDPASTRALRRRYLEGHDDGGYLADLITYCRLALRELPSAPAILPVARRAATRCAESQSRIHAAIQHGPAELVRWASVQEAGRDYAWWEVTAAAVTSLSMHALFATAAESHATPADAAAHDAAYFPAVCALGTLLDSLIDFEHDAATGNFSLVAQYEGIATAAERMGLIAERADRAVRELPRERRHAAIVSAIAAAYLSAPEAGTGHAPPVTFAVLERLGHTGALALWLMRMRRRFGSGLADAGARCRPGDAVGARP